jgi:hypothetical protein
MNTSQTFFQLAPEWGLEGAKNLQGGHWALNSDGPCLWPVHTAQEPTRSRYWKQRALDLAWLCLHEPSSITSCAPSWLQSEGVLGGLSSSYKERILRLQMVKQRVCANNGSMWDYNKSTSVVHVWQYACLVTWFITRSNGGRWIRWWRTE